MFAAPVATPAAPTLIWQEEANGAAGAVDSSKWMSRPSGWTGGIFGQSAVRPENVSYDGNGNMVIKVQREVAPWPTAYSGVYIATFNPGQARPVQTVLADFAAPYRVEARIRNIGHLDGSDVKAGKTALWNIATNTSENVEVDWNEYRATFPTAYVPHQHDWVNGVDTHSWNGATKTVTDQSKTWHVVRADVYQSKVDYWIDGVKTASAPYGVKVGMRQGIVITAAIALPGTWHAGGNVQPDPSDPGPWVALIDYIRVYQL